MRDTRAAPVRNAGLQAVPKAPLLSHTDAQADRRFKNEKRQ
jgi:hypothetical protein